MALKIYAATTDALPRLADLGYAFSGMDEVRNKFNPERWLAYWSEVLSRGRGAVFYQTNGGDEPVGAIGGILANSTVSGDLEARELFWYVDPEHRGEGGVLLQAFEAWAELSGVRRIWMSRLECDKGEVIDRLYARRGYRRQEVAYCKETCNG